MSKKVANTEEKMATSIREARDVLKEFESTQLSFETTVNNRLAKLVKD